MDANFIFPDRRAGVSLMQIPNQPSNCKVLMLVGIFTWICLKATGYDYLSCIRTNQHRPNPAERVLWVILLA